MIPSLQPNTRFDLHLHTSRSDGRFEPAEVLRRCAAGGLDVIALTDHDLGTVVPVGEHVIDGKRLHVLGGAEVSGMHHGRELHLLVYFAREIPEGFRAFCAEQCRVRATRYEHAAGRLGLDTHADPDAFAGTRSLTRHHLARALIESGRARDNSEAFARWLADGHGHVPPLTLPMVDAIRLARSYGGLTSWAHPSVPDVERWLPTFVEAGLQGLEGLRPYVTSKDRSVYKKAARRHGLFLTGGSDWHGWGEPEPGLFRLEAREMTDFLDALRAA